MASPAALAGLDLSDVVPMDTCAHDGPAAIAHDPAFARTHGLLYALVAARETSARALAVCSAVIELNAANYTAWQHRRDCLAAQQRLDGAGALLAGEFDFTARLLADTTKNYQLWHHRRWLAETTRDASRELELTAAVLADEPKNYHAWSHRLWAVREFGLWAGELAFVAAFIAEDVRNNSAWNHRFAIATRGGDAAGPLAPGIALEAELAFARDALALAPRNESALLYRDAIAAIGRGAGPAARAP